MVIIITGGQEGNRLPGHRSCRVNKNYITILNVIVKYRSFTIRMYNKMSRRAAARNARYNVISYFHFHLTRPT